MAATVDVLHPDKPKRVLIVASNPTASPVTGWPIGFWWSELTHPWWEFTEHGYQVQIVSPDGGALRADSWSDPRDESGDSADDLISLGFIESPRHAGLVETMTPLGEVTIDDHDAVLFVGGQTTNAKPSKETATPSSPSPIASPKSPPLPGPTPNQLGNQPIPVVLGPPAMATHLEAGHDVQ